MTKTNEYVQEILKEKDCLCVKDLCVGGKDLMEVGVPQGKELGQLLSWLLDQVLNEPSLNEKDILLRLVKEKREQEEC